MTDTIQKVFLPSGATKSQIVLDIDTGEATLLIAEQDCEPTKLAALIQRAKQEIEKINAI